MLQDINKEILSYYLAGTSFIFLLIAAIITYAFLHQRKVNQFRRLLQEEEIKKQQSIFAAIQEGEEKERTRLAEELHDGVGAKLAGLSMYAEYIKTGEGNKNERDVAIKLFDGINEVINELRDVSHHLQPSFLLEQGLKQSLTSYIDQLNSKKMCHFELFFYGEFEISKYLKLNCYRIITELLNNISKHAQATSATVQIAGSEGKLQLILEDNGIGYDPTSAQKGIGLTNINNRVKINGGQINIDSSSQGTTSIIEFPLN